MCLCVIRFVVNIILITITTTMIIIIIFVKINNIILK